ncbi:RidA family protein [Williamsia muralis]|uniref:Enamine deaminase RidA (YjgF/YER057c/UK114 family) n=1 Tax=Williamsia marianensis TaxID=85044 RepID=A0A2G3PJZ4_WILMA|nr:RidA family protein [Williamsia marianensis]PHV66149.1 hypothetical protein CSW57_21260 [Williamsia marianensis]
MAEFKRLNAYGGTRPLSWAVVAGETVYVAGMVGAPIDFDATTPGELIFDSSVEEQMRQTYRNIGVILERAGSSLLRIAQQTVFFTGDSREVMAANRVVRREVFGDHSPASAMAGVQNLFDPQCRLEIQAIAYKLETTPVQQ